MEQVVIIPAFKDSNNVRVITLKECEQILFPDQDSNDEEAYTLDDEYDKLVPDDEARARGVIVYEKGEGVSRSVVVQENPELAKIEWNPFMLVFRSRMDLWDAFAIDASVRYLYFDLNNQMYKVPSHAKAAGRS